MGLNRLSIFLSPFAEDLGRKPGDECEELSASEGFCSRRSSGEKIPRSSDRGASFKKGVTLTELLVAMGIAGGVSLGIVSIYMAHYRIFTNQNALIEAETQNQLAIKEIAKYAKEASFFSNKTANSTSELGLSLLPLDPGGNPYNPGYNDHVIFYRNSATKRLMRKGCSDAIKQGFLTSRPDQNNATSCNSPPITKVAASGVTGFTLTLNKPSYVDADQATITLTTESKTISGRIFTSTQTATIYIRK